MKTASLRDGSKVRVGNTVEFFGEPDHVVSGRVVAIYRATTTDGGQDFGNSVMLLVKGGDYEAEVAARHVWKADR